MTTENDLPARSVFVLWQFHSVLLAALCFMLPSMVLHSLLVILTSLFSYVQLSSVSILFAARLPRSEMSWFVASGPNEQGLRSSGPTRNELEAWNGKRTRHPPHPV